MQNHSVQNKINRLLALFFVVLIVLFSFTACAKSSNEKTEDIETLEDLNGKTIGVAIGSMHEDIVKAYLDDYTIHYYNSAADLGVALNSDLVDAIICDGAVAAALVNANSNFQMVGDSLSTERYKFGARAIIKVYDAPTQTLKKLIHNTFEKQGRMELFANGIATTAIISVASIILGAALAFAYVSYCWSRPKAGMEIKLARVFVWAVKATPILIMLMILYYIVFAKTGVSAIIISIIAFTLSATASFESILYNSMKEVDPLEEEAAFSLGYSKWQIYFKITLPQTLYLAYNNIKNEVVSIIQATSIVGYIAVQDITKVSDIIRGRTFNAFFPLMVTTLMYFALCWMIIAVVKVIELKIGPQYKTPEKILKGVEHK